MLDGGELVEDSMRRVARPRAHVIEEQLDVVDMLLDHRDIGQVFEEAADSVLSTDR